MQRCGGLEEWSGLLKRGNGGNTWDNYAVRPSGFRGHFSKQFQIDCELVQINHRWTYLRLYALRASYQFL